MPTLDELKAKHNKTTASQREKIQRVLNDSKKEHVIEFIRACEKAYGEFVEQFNDHFEKESVVVFRKLNTPTSYTNGGFASFTRGRDVLDGNEHVDIKANYFYSEKINCKVFYTFRILGGHGMSWLSSDSDGNPCHSIEIAFKIQDKDGLSPTTCFQSSAEYELKSSIFTLKRIIKKINERDRKELRNMCRLFAPRSHSAVLKTVIKYGQSSY